MQFSYIVSTNTAAVKLWKELRLAITGTIPERFGTTRIALLTCSLGSEPCNNDTDQ